MPLLSCHHRYTPLSSPRHSATDLRVASSRTGAKIGSAPHILTMVVPYGTQPLTESGIIPHGRQDWLGPPYSYYGCALWHTRWRFEEKFEEKFETQRLGCNFGFSNLVIQSVWQEPLAPSTHFWSYLKNNSRFYGLFISLTSSPQFLVVILVTMFFSIRADARELSHKHGSGSKPLYNTILDISFTILITSFRNQSVISTT